MGGGSIPTIFGQQLAHFWHMPCLCLAFVLQPVHSPLLSCLHAGRSVWQTGTQVFEKLTLALLLAYCIWGSLGGVLCLWWLEQEAGGGGGACAPHALCGKKAEFSRHFGASPPTRHMAAALAARRIPNLSKGQGLHTCLLWGKGGEETEEEAGQAFSKGKHPSSLTAAAMKLMSLISIINNNNEAGRQRRELFSLPPASLSQTQQRRALRQWQ